VADRKGQPLFMSGGNLVFCFDGLKGFDDLGLGLFAEEADHNDDQRGNQEGGKQLVNVKPGAGKSRADNELPDEDHGTAGDHTGDGTPLGGALPEQGEEHQRSEGGTEACPGKGNDLEDGAVGIAGKEDGDDGDDDNGDAGQPHGGLVGKLDAEDLLHQVLGDAGGGGKQLGVGGGHGGRENTGKDDTGHDGRQDAVSADDLCDINDDGLGGGGGAVSGNDGVLHQAIADDTDKDGNAHGDDHPYRGDAAGEGELFLILDGHEAQQDMGHAEVTETPCKGGDHGQSTVAHNTTGGDVVTAEEIQIAVQGGHVGDDAAEAAGGDRTETNNHEKGDSHNDGLNKVGGGSGEEAAEGAVKDDNGGAQHHGKHVVNAEEGGKELTAGGKAGSGVRNEEDNDEQCRDNGKDLLFIPEAAAEEIGQGKGIHLLGINAQTPCHNKPVDVGADGEANGRPNGLGQTGHQRDGGQAHQKPAAHVGGFGAHGGDQRTESASAEVELAGTQVAIGEANSDRDHHGQIQHNGNKNGNKICRHDKHLLRVNMQ